MSNVPPPFHPPLPPGLPGLLPNQTPMLMQQQPPLPPHNALLIPPTQRIPPNPTTVLIGHIPGFFRYPRNLRDYLYTCCGSVKSVAYSCEIKRAYGSNVAASATSSDSTAAGTGSSSSNTTNAETKSSTTADDHTVAVVRMAHSSGALSLVRNWKEVRRRLLQHETRTKNDSSSSSSATRELSKMRVFLLYSTNEMSPPLDASNEFDVQIIESMWESLRGDKSVPSPTIVPGTDVDLQRERAANENVISKLVECYETIRTRQETMDSSSSTALSSSYHTGATGDRNVLKEEMERNGDKMDGTTTVSGTAVAATSEVETVKSEEEGRKLDVNKVAAAAGGGVYDEEADPLNAPAVLEAVARFKKELEESSGRIKKQRAEYVDKRLAEETKKAKVMILERRKREKEEEEERKKNASLPVRPPLPPPLPPVGGLPLPPPPVASIDSGKRGVSNLPSWMTSNNDASSAEVGGGAGAKRPAEDVVEKDGPSKMPRSVSEANRDINSRKPGRLDTGDSSLADIRAANEAADAMTAMKSWTKEQILEPTALFPPMLSNLEKIQEFVKEQIVEYLGEEEQTLIDFVMNHLAKAPIERTIKALLDELSEFLDEDAEIFVVDLFKKILE